MVQRTSCLCDGKEIGIESIFTVTTDGSQIYIPEKLKWLRQKSQNDELFCTCGCGANLILVAGDRMKREQHFRVKNGTGDLDCYATTETKTSKDSKIVLKCWLDDKLKIEDVVSRIPINSISDANKKYEFSFLSKAKGIGLIYCHQRTNLSDEKFEIIEQNSSGIKVIYVVDISNGGCNGQYPEHLYKIQQRQKYCLLLIAYNEKYEYAEMRVVCYAKSIDDTWEEIKIADGKLKDFSFDENGNLLLNNQNVHELREIAQQEFKEKQDDIKANREEFKKCAQERIKRQIEEHKRIVEERKSRQIKSPITNNQQVENLIIKKQQESKANIPNEYYEQERKKKNQIYEETGKFVGKKFKGEYETFTIEELTVNKPPKDFFAEFTKDDFKKHLNCIKEDKSSFDVQQLFRKICFVSQTEKIILRDLYEELLRTDKWLADVLKYICNRAQR